MSFRTSNPSKVTNQRSGWRTAGVTAAGAGVGYAGVQAGTAARALRKILVTAQPHLVGTAANVEAVSGAVRKVGAPMTAVRKLLRMSASLRKDEEWRFGFGASVAQDRYKKTIKEHESDRAESNYARSALVGAALGALLHAKGTRGHAALLGAAAGVGTQAVVRAATAPTKDTFGDRPLGAKRLEKLPWQAGGVAAGVLGYRRLAGRAAAVRRTVGLHAVMTTRSFGVGASVAAKLRKVYTSEGLLAGGALAGGITVADTIAATTERKPNQSVAGTLAHGAKKGALYGTVLAGSEPLIHALLKVATRRKGTTALQSRQGASKLEACSKGALLLFGGYQQLRGEKNRFVDPLEVAAGTAAAYGEDGPVHLPVRHAQVVRAALNKGKAIQIAGKRAGGLVRDASEAVRGIPKVDSRGRPQRREWEKPWFRNVAGTVASGAALLGHAALMKRNPAYRTKVAGLVRQGKTTANRLVPDLFPLRSRLRPVVLSTPMASRVVQLDITAPNWDVRDERGRSARVFAPGAQRRQRREKEWYEKSDNQRKLLGGLAVVAGVGGLIGGYKLGTSLGVKRVRSALAKQGWATRRAGAAENAVIERMKKRPPGGSAVS